MGLKKVITILLITLIAGVVCINAQPVVNVQLNTNEYSLGELIEVNVNLSGNTGLHGMYFDLSYDSNVFEFDDVVKSQVINDEIEENQLVYAYSENNGAHVIVSYTLNGNNKITVNNGNVVKLWFRVKNQGVSGEQYQFSFNNCGIIDGNGDEITGTTWNNSGLFSIKSPYTGTFILIKEPYEYEVLYKDQVNVNLICSTGNFKVKLSNEDNPSFTPVTTNVTSGVLLNEVVTLTYGFNRISANLYDVNDNLLCKDTVKVYRSTDDKFIKIVDPQNHSLLNTDMAEVTVHSPYDNVLVNGVNADYYGETVSDTHAKVYKARLWLKEGFNKISASAKSPEGVTYKDEIDVYYQKDANIFNFVLPRQNESFKPGDDAKLIIKGEIDSMYKTSDDPATGGAIENTVTLKVIYRPKSSTGSTRILVNNQMATIAESDFGYESVRSKYIFYNDFDISLADLDNGELEIIAYKNKEGSNWDNEIHRIVYIDNNRLWIDLVQPNVFTSDVLDTYQKVKDFNEANDLSSDGNIEISNDGGIVLKSTDRVVSAEGLSNVSSIVERSDGTMYALVNDTANGLMKIYKKSYSDTTWVLALSKAGFFGYKLCDCDIGILVGVSGLFSTENSELYLLRDNKLIKIDFGSEIIRDVKFVENHNGKIYIYGSYYDYLYSFNTYALEEENSNLKVSSLSKFNFANSYNIKEFMLTEDGLTAVLRTETNDIYFYRRSSDQYLPINMPLLNGSSDINGEHIVCGEYSNSDYNTYLIIKDMSNVEIIMANKNTGGFNRSVKDIAGLLGETTDPITLLGAGYKDNSFVFLYKKNSGYFVKRGQVFFDHFYPEISGFIEDYQYTDIVKDNYKIFLTGNGSIYLGIDNESLFSFYSKYKDQGECEFNYVNDDIDGLTGFEFEVDPLWIESSGVIEFAFELREKSGDQTAPADNVIFKLDNISLDQLLDPNAVLDESFYKIHHNYDAGLNREIVHFEFNELVKNKYINFKIKLNSIGNATPGLYNLRIFKKIRAKICNEPGSKIILPVHGYVYDSTVKVVNIEHIKVALDRDGSFYHDLEITSGQNIVPIEIYCQNGSGETTSINFTVEIVDSSNDVWDAEYKRTEDSEYSQLLPTATDFIVNTTKDKISLKGKYYGLAGCVVGYEIYSYDTEDSSKVNLAKRGVFDLTKSESVYDLTTLGSGYEAGYYSKNDIELIPGRQRLVIYCENPGGLRIEYKVDGKYPDIMYNMPQEDQEIVFYLDDLTPAETINTVPIKSKLNLETYESESSPYTFTREYEISGWIKSLYNFADLKIKSFTNGLSFENDSNEITINVDEGNRFNIKFKLTMNENDFVKDFNIGVFPIKSFLSYLKAGFRVTAKKSYKNTNYIPDFSQIHPDNWTTEEKESLNIPIKLAFNRNDVPTELTTGNKGYIEAKLLVNYENELTGIIYEDNGYYYLDDTAGISNGRSPLHLTGDMIKEGVNRIQWSLTFRDFVDNTTDGTPSQMSYSGSGKAGMNDYIFEYHNESAIEPTLITFIPDLTNEYYDSTTLPSLSITKDKRTVVDISVGDRHAYHLQVPWDSTGTTATIGYNELKDAINEGRNDITIKYTEPDNGEIVKTYTVMFDSKAPIVNIESYKVNSDYTKLLELTASTTEANFSEAFLYYGSDIINRMPDVVIKSSDKYQLIWHDLSSDNITPSTAVPVKVRVDDLSGKSAESGLLTGFEDITRPEETGIKEIEIKMPQYEESPKLSNETNFTSRDFPGHTKIAPEKFLKRVSIKDNVEDNGNYLIKAGKNEKAEPVYWSKCESWDNVANADIGSATIVSQGSMASTSNTTYAKYGQSIYAYSVNDSATFTINNSNKNKGAISYWSYSGGGDGIIRIKFNETSNDHIDLGKTSSTQRIVIGGSIVDSTSGITGMHHYYIVWDKDKGLDGGKSIRVFIDNNEILSTTNDITNFGLNNIKITCILNSAYLSFDNLKMWDYIPSEDPSAINEIGTDEDLKTTEDFFKPIFLSKCESIADITSNPDIGNGTGLQSGIGINTGKFGNCLYSNSSLTYSNGYFASWYPQGNNFNLSKKGTLSFWIKCNQIHGFYLFMGSFYVYWIDDGTRIGNVPHTGINYTCNNEDNTWHHMYLVWDEDGFDDGNKVKLYKNDELIISTNIDISNWSVNENLRFRWWDSSSGSSEYISIDNVKLWDHVVSETPDWLENIEGDEDLTDTGDNDLVPDYWNKCEIASYEGMTTLSDIYDENNPPYETHTSDTNIYEMIDNSMQPPAKFGKGISFQPGQSDYNDIYPFGDLSSDISKGAFSAWMYIHGDSNRLGAFNFNFNQVGTTRVQFRHELNGKWYHEIMVNGIKKTIIDNSTISVGSTNELAPVYIIWDETGSLDNGTKKIRVFVNNIEIMSLSKDEEFDVEKIYFRAVAGSSTSPNGNVPICFDNVKIWKNKIPSEDPTYITTSEVTSSLPEDYGKYLVFKVAKDPFVNNITTKDDIVDKIKFEVVGKVWDETTNQPIEVINIPDSTITNPLTIEEEYKRYIEGTNYVYYMVRSDILKAKYESAKASMTAPDGPLDPNGEAVVIDPGSLRVKYSEEWTNFKPVDIYLVGKQDGDGGEIYNAFKDIIVYDPGYESYSMVGEDTNLHPDIRHSLYESDESVKDRSFVHDASSDAMSISWWMRLEDDGIEEDIYAAQQKRVITLGDDTSDLINFSYKGKELIYIDNVNPHVSIANLAVGKDAWSMITLVIDKAEHNLKIYINDELAYTIDTLPEVTIDKLLLNGSKYYFGAGSGESFNTGFYSVALPFYINRILTDEEIERLYNLYDKNTGGDITNSFTDKNSVYGPANSDLHNKLNSTDFFDSRQNSDYTENLENGSFKTSSIHKNLLVVKNIDTDQNVVILNGAADSIKNNIIVTAGVDSFTITPAGGSKGRYYFGDKSGNYGLGKDRWYSVAGEVSNIAEGTNAYLVLRINGEEEKIRLQKGHFHFVYDNGNEVTPSDVKMYVETDGVITLSTAMSLNDGNYVIEESMAKSAATTLFPFNLAGTVSFWFKPLNSNKDGFVNYDGVIFDSEYVKIGTKLVNGDAIYYALVKKADGSAAVTLDTNVKVTGKWQYIQLSYSTDEDVVYFYIDGKVAGKSESTNLPVFGSLQGITPTSDNVYIGYSNDGLEYAEGYIDNLLISKYYLENKYQDNNPVNVEYDGALSVNLNYVEPITESNATDILYKLESLDKGYSEEGNTFPIDLSSIPSGRYRLTTTMDINGHNFKDITSFNIDNKPKFELVEKSPIVFSSAVDNITNNVGFKFRVDNSHKFKNDTLVYSGLAVKISYNNSANSVIKYLTQDHLDNDNTKWLVGTENGTNIDWTSTTSDNTGSLSLDFNNILTTTKIDYEVKYFYITTSFGSNNRFENISEIDLTNEIPLAGIHYEKATYEVIEADGTSKFYEYKLEVSVLDEGESVVSGEALDVFKNIKIGYTIKNESNVTVKSGDADIDSNGISDLYYDDVLPDYGVYTANLNLKYNNKVYASVSGITLNWKEKSGQAETILESSKLEIEEFSLLYVDKNTDDANIFLRYYVNNVGTVTSTVYVIQNGSIYAEYEEDLTNMSGTNSMVFENVKIPKGASTIKISLRADGFMDSQEININNFIGAPEIVLTNWVESLIPYNNVLFSWKGYYEGKFNENIEYTYNFDNSGWSTPNKEWRNVRFYNLEEGYHSFEVKAVYNGIESAIRAVRFFVDVARPVFDDSKITVQKIYDSKGVFYAVNIIGDANAIVDASLQEVYIDGKKLTYGVDGNFIANNIILTKDGINKITITAIDKVGNFTDHVINVENNITNIIFPDVTKNVKYCPMSIVGSISKDINNKMEIYVKDPYCEDKEVGDYSGWKKAKINADRTFFIEDVYVNPGTRTQELLTTLTLKCVFASGKEFEKEINVWANEIIMPIQMTLNTHAAEGENADTIVEINAKANVSNISNWSIDYNGDGIYDDVYIVNNPSSKEAESHTWTHKYSSLGLVKPRVRVITTDGNFFSVTDTLIIHEKIKEASNTLIDRPISLSTVSMMDNSKMIFVLKDNGVTPAHNYVIEMYKVGRNETYISDRVYSINVTSLLIDNPVCVRAIDEDHIIIGTNESDLGVIYEIAENSFGNYVIVKKVNLNYKLKDITLDQYNLFASFTNQQSIVKMPIAEKIINETGITYITPEILNSVAMNANVGLAKDDMGLLIADYYNQRVIRLSNAMKINNQFGSFGVGEGEFLKPAIIKSYENRIFVFDEARHDIQVFDLNFKSVCKLEYSANPEYHNYLEPDFFNDIADIDIIAKVENNLLYYYALILSKTSGKLAMLKLPQWEELRARVRNNKVVFIQDGEVFTAKPDGSDLTKVLSSDSIPRVEGTLDYPALSPDGKSLVFTSKTKLYNGEPVGSVPGSEYAYDNIYVVDIETKVLTKIDLGSINGYEIERPVFNSNGDKIIFSAKETGKKWQIYVYSFETKTIVKLFASDENARFPYYSPDDRFVVFTTDYEGNEEIEIIDTQNTAIRVSVTNNTARDSLPVWNTVYPFEILNQDLKIESKIGFVSERNYHKGIYYVYLSRKSDSDIRVVKKSGEDIGSNPDSAAIEITNAAVEGDYPCFTGDGKQVVFEYFDGETQILKKYDFEHPENGLTNMELPGSAVSPAGMKNMIANFNAVNKNGNQIELTWNRYTQNDIYYNVRFKKNAANEPYAEKKVFSQSGTILDGMEMGAEYLVKACIIENEEEVATSQWKKIKMPEVVARPTYEIDPDNPYLVNLHAWKPKPETEWNFEWIIDNQPINVSSATDYSYEFATSGTKTILLKASNKGNTATNYSAPMEVNIISDIKPVIEYNLAEDSSSIYLNALSSEGKKIDFTKTEWTITGTVSGTSQEVKKRDTSETTVTLNGFTNKIYINLKLHRVGINGQTTSDVIEKNMVIDLDFKQLKPIITYSVNQTNNRLLRFSGEQSIGNIDWTDPATKWTLFANNGVIYTTERASTFEYLFPESNNDTVYTVTLTVKRGNDGMTESVSQVVSVEATPIEPVIDYEVMTLTSGSTVTGAKILFDCSKSKGSDIDFASARWSLPLAGNYGEQSVQTGPTALYSLIGAGEDLIVEVGLTLTRRGGTDPITITKLININKEEMPDSKLVVTRNIEEGTDGKVVILDVLKSTGPNINWENTEWLIDGTPYSRRGPVARVDVPASSTKTTLNYVCTLYRYGAEPQVEKGVVTIDKITIIPLISYRKLSTTQDNVYELSVLDTKGVNIDWEKTHWYIYDGNENVVEKTGAKVGHTFALKSEQMGYPVMVEIYLKGSSYPFVNYTTIDVEGNELIPIITYDAEEDDPNILVFIATTSKGSNIDWTNAKWTFGDSSETQYGSTSTHKYPIAGTNTKYRVTLTLNRRSTNGSVETRVAYKDITIGKDELKAVIKAKVEGDYIILSAEQSKGKGLLLDRSVWTFAGSMNSESFTKSTEDGIIKRTTANESMKNSFTSGFNVQVGAMTQSMTIDAGLFTFTSMVPQFYLSALANTGFQNTAEVDLANIYQKVDSSDYKNFNETFTNSDSHVGAICRRLIVDKNGNPISNIYVSLFVYRMLSDGSMTGESVTVNVNVDKAKSGVTYE